MRPLAEIFVELGEALGSRGRHAEAAEALRQAIRERDDGQPDYGQSDDGQPDGWVLTLLADQLEQDGRVEEAFTAALDALVGAPARAEDLLPRLQRHVQGGALAGKAERFADEDWLAVVGAPGLADSVREDIAVFLSGSLLRLGMPTEAVSVLRRALSYGKESPRLLEELATACEACGLLPEAVARLGRAAGLARAAGRRDALSSLSLRLAVLLEAVGEVDDAEARLSSVWVVEPPAAARLLAVTARCRLRRGESEEALRRARSAVGLDPRSMYGARTCATVLLAGNDYEEAIKAADAGLARVPEDSELSFLRMAALLESQQDLPRAEARFERLIARIGAETASGLAERTAVYRRPEDGNGHYLRAVVAHASGDRPQALRAIERALELGLSTGELDADVPALRLRAVLNEKSGDPEAAAADYAAAGAAAYNRSLFPLAGELFETAEGLWPLPPESRWVYAAVLAMTAFHDAEWPEPPDEGLLGRALELWEQAAEYGEPEGDLLWAYISRAQIRVELAKLGTAHATALLWSSVGDIETYLLLGPGNSVAHRTLSDAARGLELYANAAAELEAAHAQEPDDPYLWSTECVWWLNAGDPARTERLLTDVPVAVPEWERASNEARLRVLQKRPREARKVLESIGLPTGELGAVEQWLWLRCHWALGDRAAFTALVRECLAMWRGGVYGRHGRPDVRRNIGWMMLYAGEADQALAHFKSLSAAESWVNDAAAEVAIARLAGGEIAEGEGEFARYLRAARSFEDLSNSVYMDLPVLDLVYGDRAYADELHAATARLGALAAARLADDPWPSTPAGEAEKALESLAAGQDTAPRLLSARQYTQAGDWAAALAQYRQVGGAPGPVGDMDATEILAMVAAQRIVGGGIGFVELDSQWARADERIRAAGDDRGAFAEARGRLLRLLSDRLGGGAGLAHFDEQAERIVLELGTELIPAYVGAGWELWDRLREMKDTVLSASGVDLPDIVVREGSANLGPRTFCVLIDGVTSGTWELPTEDEDEDVARAAPEGTRESVTGYLGEFVGTDAAARVVESWTSGRATTPWGTDGAVGGRALVRITAVLRRLAADGVPLGEPEPILDALADGALDAGSVEEALRRVRLAIAPRLPGAEDSSPRGQLLPDTLALIARAGTGDREWEEQLAQALGEEISAMPPGAALIVPAWEDRRILLASVDFGRTPVRLLTQEELDAAQQQSGPGGVTDEDGT
ncbi:hypothetical protein ACGFSB_07640 [Streptomyces sp. NPDC048441]|uniref:hypothetical protein n=1 Tax=Streptomyces sp. NPDC048441 TaxID=3365552 RepID=UPI0037221274